MRGCEGKGKGEALQLVDDKAGGADQGFGIAIGVAAAGATAPESKQAVLTGAEGGTGWGGDMFEKNEGAAGAERLVEGSEGGGGIGNAAEDEGGEDGVIGACWSGEGGGVEGGAGGERDRAGEPGIGLIAGPGDAWGEIAEIDAVAGADLENVTGEPPEEGLFAGSHEGFVKAADKPHQKGEPHLFEFDGDGAVRLVAFVGELWGGFAFVVPDDFAGFTAADGEFAGDRVFAFVGAIVEENNDLIGGAHAGWAGLAGKIGGVENADFGIFEGRFDREGGSEERSRHKSG
jgi:hypothetical protein